MIALNLKHSTQDMVECQWYWESLYSKCFSTKEEAFAFIEKHFHIGKTQFENDKLEKSVGYDRYIDTLYVSIISTETNTESNAGSIPELGKIWERACKKGKLLE